MASSEVYVPKREEVPVDPCKGWFDACEYCDKRFGDWISLEEETLEKIPEKPGFLMIGLLNKNMTEVVSLIFNASNIQKSAYDEVESVRNQISDKKNKATKSTIQLRWMTFKKLDGKEICALCAHWSNNGVLPKYLTVWPGLEFLETSDTLVFSKNLQRWCHLKKDPVWRKAKSQPTKVTEVVTKCNWNESCETCDSHFTPWQTLLDVIDENSLPSSNGIFMISVLSGKKREVLYLGLDKQRFCLHLGTEIKLAQQWLGSERKSYKNGVLQVRWKVLNDSKFDDKICLLLAHWLNADCPPLLNSSSNRSLSDVILTKNKNFEYKINDKKWCYVTDTLRNYKSSKEKNRRELLEDLTLMDDEYLD